MCIIVEGTYLSIFNKGNAYKIKYLRITLRMYGLMNITLSMEE